MTPTDKLRCKECDWVGSVNETDYVTDPKREDNGWTICPRCRGADTVSQVCDEPGCDQFATCGVLVPDGYRQVCGKHGRQLDRESVE